MQGILTACKENSLGELCPTSEDIARMMFFGVICAEQAWTVMKLLNVIFPILNNQHIFE